LDIQEAVKLVLSGRAVLFTGAGFSLGALNLRGEPFKTGRQFAAHLAGMVGLPETTGLEDASEWFTDQLGQGRLIEEMQQEFTVKQVSPSHVEMLSHPWRRLYTTNYDNVAEIAAAQSGKRLTPATLSDAIHTLPRTGTLSVHLNGFIDRLDASNINSDIKLTDTSYLTNTVATSPWATTLRQDLDAARAIFFVGYSTADIDIRRLLFERPSLKEKCFFIVGSAPDAVAKQRIERFGAVLNMDLGTFASTLKTAAKSHSPQSDLAPLNYSVQRFEPPTTRDTFEDRMVFDLFLHGDIDLLSGFLDGADCCLHHASLSGSSPAFKRRNGISGIENDPRRSLLFFAQTLIKRRRFDAAELDMAAPALACEIRHADFFLQDFFRGGVNHPALFAAENVVAGKFIPDFMHTRIADAVNQRRLEEFFFR
jgi:hypothetical protein